MKSSIFSKIVALLLISLMLLTAVGCDMASIFGDMMIDEGNGINQDDTSLLGKYTGIGKETENTSRETAEAPTEIAGEETDVCENEDTAEIEFSTSFTDLDFEGEEISILCAIQAGVPHEWKFTASEDQIEEIITQINRKAMDDLNLSMATTTLPYNNNYSEYASNVISTITNDVIAGINEYDLSSNLAVVTAAPAIRDYAADLLDEDRFPYLDFSLPCWNANFVKNNTVNGHLFYAIGDIGTVTIDSAIVMWYNEELYNMNRDDRDPENLQELAIEGRWTYETLFDWTNRLYLDLDGLPGITADDTFALIAPEKSSYCASAFASAWDISFVKENGNNTHTFSIDIPALKYAVDCYKELLSAYGTTTDSTAKKFVNGNSLFYIGRLDDGYRNGSELRESELMSMAACSMLPMPKFNMDQESYKTALAGEHSLLLALNHDDYRSGVALSAFLQYSTELWSKEIKPYYIESHILLKHLTHTSDQHARTSAILYDMLDNIDFDYENVYSSQLGNVTNFWNQVITSSQEISTLYNSRKSNYEAAINDTDTWFKSK